MLVVVVDLTQGTARLKKLNDDKVHVVLFDNMDRLPRYVRGWGIKLTTEYLTSLMALQ